LNPDTEKFNEIFYILFVISVYFIFSVHLNCD
jgi:hypothetical protein